MSDLDKPETMERSHLEMMYKYFKHESGAWKEMYFQEAGRADRINLVFFISAPFTIYGIGIGLWWIFNHLHIGVS